MAEQLNRIGVKYCGGCNPRYNRRQAVEELESRLSNVNVEIAAEGERYNTILLVCGCTAQCIREWRGAEADQYLSICSRDGFLALAEKNKHHRRKT